MDYLALLTAFIVASGFLFTWIIGSGKPIGWLLLAGLQSLEIIWISFGIVPAHLESGMILIIQAIVFAIICVRNYYSTKDDIHVTH